MKQLFEGVFSDGRVIYTKNARPGQKVYTEKLLKEGNEEFREWVPSKSKLGAAVRNGLRNFPFAKDSTVLYLGSSTGTTPSHLSDIVTQGTIFCVEFAERVMREFMHVAKQRTNLIPIMADARKPQLYEHIGIVDVVYEDVAQPDQVEIGLRNAEKFLKNGGLLMIAIKARSIDVTEKPSKIYKTCEQKLEGAGYNVLETVNLEPHEKDHALIVAKKP